MGETGAGTPEESWRDIHETMDRARSSMYVAGTATIMLLWAAIASLGVGSQYAILTLASEFAERSPWIFGVLWGILMVPGMVGSGLIGRRAGRKIAPGDAARSAGIRVFLYWLAVVVAVFLIPAAAGMWNAEDGDNIPGVSIGIVSLGYILFGIMHRPVLAAVGVGFAAAFYIPNYSRVPGSGVRGRGSGERETTASSLAGKQQAREKEENGGQGKDGPAGAIAQGGNGR